MNDTPQDLTEKTNFYDFKLYEKDFLVHSPKESI